MLECKLLSHPDKLLFDHLSGVHKIGLNVFNRNQLFPECEKFLAALLLLHDLGKASSHFQTYITGSGKVHEQLKRHAEISALWFYFYAREVLKEDEKKVTLGYIIIKYHHADFTNFKKMCINSLDSDTLLQINDNIDYKEMRIIYKKMPEASFFEPESFKKHFSVLTRNGSIKSERKIRKELSVDDYFFLNYFFSVLLTADKCDAIVNQDLSPVRTVWKDSFVDKYKQKFTPKDDILTRIRNESYLETESNLDPDTRFFSINLPTGSGKTLTVLNAALKLKEQNSLQRVIYCLPFTSVIDQNARVFEDILECNNIQLSSDVLLKHHHLTELEYIARFQDEDRIYSSKNSEFFIEGWESELIVTTFYQLLHTLLSNKNRVLRKFHNLANSVVVLDEVQAIPSKFWYLIKKMFQQCATTFNIRFMLVTATMPLIFSEADREIKELAMSKQHYFDSLGRIRLNTEQLDKILHIDDFKDAVLDDISHSPEKSRLVILNTVKSSLEVYSFLKENLGSDNLVYLSSNIIPKERLKRILEIKRDPKGKVVVSTQLVEAGVDIDVDVVYRDMAPLDCIFQACGRCNRNNSGTVSEVKLYVLTNGKKPYYSYIYDDVLVDSGFEILRTKKIFEEREFLSLSRNYFEKIISRDMGPESETIFDNINKLMLSTAFVPDKVENQPVFQLIESFPVVSAFIETDDDANEILMQYEEIMDKSYSDPFEKRVKLKEIHRKMAPYLINIPARSASNAGYDEALGKIWFINSIIVENHYDRQTGFKRDQEVVDYIF